MKNKVLILGYLSYTFNGLCGQSIKSRNIHELLKLNESQFKSIECFDTELFKLSKTYVFKMFWKIINCDKLIYIPAQNNLKYLFPIIYFLCRCKNIDITYFVVGGWLSEYLKTKKLHSVLLAKIRCIFTESNQLRDNLKEDYKYDNVVTLHNFRVHSYIPSFQNNNDGKFRIVFAARINRMKGLDAIFDIAKRIVEAKKASHFIIDFYGHIEKEDEAYFKTQINRYSFISYKGILKSDNIYNILSNYHVLLLPTRFYTEGFPGSVLDSYIAGVPVIVTNWKYASEFVDNYKTGFIVPFENGEETLYEYITRLDEDKILLEGLKKNSYEKSKMFSAEYAWKIIENYITS